MAAWALLAVGVLAWCGGCAAQNSMYSAGGCRITGRTLDTANVTCGCRQWLAQTDESLAIDELTIAGCAGDSQDARQEAVSVRFLPPRRSSRGREFVLLDVRAVNMSAGRFQLEPVSHAPGAARHPLRRLHIEFAELDSLPDGALQGLAQLRHVSLLQVAIGTVHSGALADLRDLRSLTIIDSAVSQVTARVLVRTPRLRQLHVIRSEMRYVYTGAFVVEADSTGDADADVGCPASASAGVLSEPAAGVPSLFIANSTFVSLSRDAVRFVGAQHFVFANNTVSDVGVGALNVTLRARCAGAPLFQFVDNDLVDVRERAVAVRAEGPAPATLVLGGNTLQSAALSPRQLLLTGPFAPLDGGEWARRHPNWYECHCCDCADTGDLLALAAGGAASDTERLVFVHALAVARCVADDRPFRSFAVDCVPGLEERLRTDNFSLPATVATPTAAAGSAPTAAPLLVALAAVLRG